MRGIAELRVVAGTVLTVGALAACGSAATVTVTDGGLPASTSSTSSASSTATPTLAPAPTPAPPTPVPPTASLPATRIEVASLGIVASLTSVTCDSFSMNTVPTTTTVDFADCTSGDSGFAGFIGAGGGPLQPLASAPMGTQVVWYFPAGSRHTASITGDPITLHQNPDGTWPGHGIPPHAAFFEIRTGSDEVERGSTDRT